MTNELFTTMRALRETTSANYETKRVYIEPLESSMVLKPQEPASFDMLDLVEHSPAVPHRE